MIHAEFDSYVEVYAQQHADSIRLSGEAPDYFAEYKIREMKRLANGWGMTSPEILDFGSGIGNSLPALRKFFPNRRTTTADVSSQSLDLARRLHGLYEPQLLMNDRVPADDNSFDITFTACVFHHIPEDEHIHWLSEMARVTRPGGRLVLFEHNPWNPATRHAVRNCPFDENAVLISPPEMRRRVAKAGWNAPRIDFHLFFPRPLAALRPAEGALRWCPAGAQYTVHASAPK